MANELSRKGIAFGAAVALGSTLIVGGVANAAPNANYQDLTLTPAVDSNGILATTTEDYFGLVVGWSGNFNTQNLDDLAYKVNIVDDAGTEDEGEGYGWMEASYGWYEDEDNDTYVDDYETWVYGDDFEDVSPWDSSSGTTFYAPHAGVSAEDNDSWDITNGALYDNTEDLDYNDAPVIEFGLMDSNPVYKTDYTVQAFIDTNHNGVIDGTETHSAATTVTFYDEYNLTPVLTLADDGVVFSDDTSGSIDYEVAFAEKFNDYYTEDDDNSSSAFYGNYAVVSLSDNSWDDEDSIYADWSEEGSNTEDGTLGDVGSVDWDNYDEVDDNGSRVTVAVYNYDEDVEDFVTEFQTVTFKSQDIVDVVGAVVEQDYVSGTYDYEGEDDFSYDLESALIREDIESLDYVLTFTDSEDNPVANAEVEVELYDVVTDWADEDYYDLSGDDLAELYNDDYGLTVNGETFNAEDYGYFVTGTTNADGELTLNIEVENPDDDLYLGVNEIHVQGMTIDEDGADLWWDETEWDIEFDSGIEDDTYFSGEIGTEFTFGVSVADQWDQVPPSGSRVWVYDYYDDADWDYDYIEVKNGRAEVTIVDGTGYADEDGEDDYYEVGFEAKISGGYDDSFVGDDELYIYWYETDATVDYVTSAWSYDDGFVGNTYGDWISGSSYFADFDEDGMTEIWSGDYEYIYGTVHAANGYDVAGAEVTISGSGLFFLDDYGYEVAANSLTVRADVDGDYGVYVFGHTVGEHTVTVTSNGKSTTETLTITDDQLYASAVAVSPFTGKAGTSENITATVTDKWGNLVPDVDVTFSVTGGGYFVDDVDTTGGDADEAVEDVAEAGYGQATEMLVILSNEVGYGSTVTATIDVSDPFGIEEDTTASASLAAGATDFGKPAFWSKDIGNGEVKLYAKNIVGAGKIQFFHNGKEVAWIKAADALDPKLRAANGSYYLVRTLKLVSGKNVFEIKDDGARVVRRVASK